MPYRFSHFYRYGNINDCTTGTHWYPGGGGDSNDSVRTAITYAYMSWFGRWGELAGVENWVGLWVYGSGQSAYGTISNMIYWGGVSSGEISDVARYGKHTMGTTGSCPIRGCTNPNASNYNSSAQVDDGTCIFNPPTVSLSISPNPIVAPASSTISWYVSNAYYIQLTDFGSVSSSGSGTIQPSSTRTYTLSATGYGGFRSISRTLTVYQKPNLNMTVDSSTITLGSSTVLRWTTTGDASSLSISPVPGNTNLNSYVTITPTVTTTYSGYASGPGGSDSDSITVTVLQPPVVTLDGPLSISYGDDIILSMSQVNATVAYFLTVVENDLDGNQTTRTIDFLNNTSISQYTDTITYHNRGPASVSYSLKGEGQGGLYDIAYLTVPINIDQMPDVIDIPASEDKLKNEEPVITPDIQITSQQLTVTDIDIPVEIKSDYPIQVEVDGGIFKDVREI